MVKARGITLLEAIVIIAVLVILTAILYPVYQAARPVPPKTHCLSNVKQLVLSTLMYANDNDDRYPKSGEWMDRLESYTKYKNIFHDVEGVPEDKFGYAFRRSLSLRDSNKITAPEQTIIIFDSNSVDRNAASELETIPSPGRHDGFNSFGFADGHAKYLKFPEYVAGFNSPIFSGDSAAWTKLSRR